MRPVVYQTIYVVLTFESKLIWKGSLTLWDHLKQTLLRPASDLHVRAIKHPITINVLIKTIRTADLSQEEAGESNMMPNLAFMHLSGQLKLKLAFCSSDFVYKNWPLFQLIFEISCIWRVNHMGAIFAFDRLESWPESTFICLHIKGPDVFRTIIISDIWPCTKPCQAAS